MGFGPGSKAPSPWSKSLPVQILLPHWVGLGSILIKWCSTASGVMRKARWLPLSIHTVDHQSIRKNSCRWFHKQKACMYSKRHLSCRPFHSTKTYSIKTIGNKITLSLSSKVYYEKQPKKEGERFLQILRISSVWYCAYLWRYHREWERLGFCPHDACHLMYMCNKDNQSEHYRGMVSSAMMDIN